LKNGTIYQSYQSYQSGRDKTTAARERKRKDAKVELRQPLFWIFRKPTYIRQKNERKGSLLLE
jgi:hypothetical protein